MKDFRLTENFTFFQVTGSRDHPGLVAANRAHFLKAPYFDRLKVGTEYCLQSIQDELKTKPYGTPEKYPKVIVSNGGRFPALNDAVGGARDSQHKFERLNDGAFDFTVLELNIFELENIIRWRCGLAFHQLRIYKWDSKNKRGNFIHFGMPLSWKDGRVDYPYGEKSV